MKSLPDLNFSRKFRIMTVAMGILYVVLLVILFYKRIFFPLELAGIEGSMLNSILQLVAGEALYTTPTFNYAGPAYNPLDIYVSAFISTIFEMKIFSSLRLISAASTIGNCGRIFFAFIAELLVVLSYLVNRRIAHDTGNLY